LFACLIKYYAIKTCGGVEVLFTENAKGLAPVLNSYYLKLCHKSVGRSELKIHILTSALIGGKY
jgi:hypothetical protein